MNTKDILQALRLLGKAPKDQLEKAMSDLDLTEAVKADAMHLKASEEVDDLYNDMHAVPSREEINMGPGEAASGAGAEKMIRDYSSPAPQVGTQLDYERVAKMFGEMVKAQKEQTTAIKHQSDLLLRVAESLQKAEDKEDEPEDEDKEEEAAEKARSYTETLLQKADEIIVKADKLSDKLGSIKSAKTQKVIKSRIAGLMKEVNALLAKARRGVLFVADESLTDQFNDIAVKAESDLVESEEDKDDEKEEKKAAKKAEVSQQADGQDEEDNQPSESESSKAILSRVEKALAGMEVMHGEVKDIFDAMSTTSRGKVVSTAALAKSKVEVDDTEQVFARMSKSVMSHDEATMCDNLIQIRELVKGGAKSPRDFELALKKAPDSVKAIFA